MGTTRRTRSIGLLSSTLLAACGVLSSEAAPTGLHEQANSSSDSDGGAPGGGDTGGAVGAGSDPIPASCPPKESPGARASATSPGFYPAPRSLSVGALGARVHTVCIDTTALSPSSALVARLATLTADAGLALGTPGSCDCDWGIKLQSTPLDLPSPAADVWARGAGKSERFAFRTTSSADHRAHTVVSTSSERGALDALRMAMAITGGTPARAADATVVDYPSFHHRGLLEGFYGRSFTAQQRGMLIALHDALRLDTYVYAPKCDCFATQASWREAYPPGPAPEWVTNEACGDCEGTCQPVSADDIRAAAEDASRRLVRFVWAFSPFHANGFDFDAYARDLARLKGKVDSLRSLGVSRFALLIDDVGSQPGRDGTVAQAGQHATLANALDAYVRKADPSAHIIMIGATYQGAPNAYTTALGKALAPGIEVLWTGREIVPRSIDAADLVDVNASLARNVSLWDNWAYEGMFARRSGNLATAATSYYVNPVHSECVASRPQTTLPDVTQIQQSLGTIADYTWFAERYASEDASMSASHAAWMARLPKLLASPPAP